MSRKREDPATVGDLEDLAEATRKGFGEALKDVLGSVIPAPTPKDPSAGDPPAEDPPADPPATDWGFSGRWWGAKK